MRVMKEMRFLHQKSSMMYKTLYRFNLKCDRVGFVLGFTNIRYPFVFRIYSYAIAKDSND